MSRHEDRGESPTTSRAWPRVHTRTRTAYYTAGGMPEEQLAEPRA
ncbi:hypothetical protein ACGFY9_17325 [Streptomyces sp. NPDC048504]